MSGEGPVFLTRQQIGRLHELGITKFGGSRGVRYEGLIDSALASAKNAFFYGSGDLFDIRPLTLFTWRKPRRFMMETNAWLSERL